MYLSRLTIQPARVALGWLSNPYRIHQRLMMACAQEPRLLFRLEEEEAVPRILVQTHLLPDWAAAFNAFPILSGLPEIKTFDPQLAEGGLYAFRLLANPTAKRGGARLGLGREEEQSAWLTRRLADAGADVLRCAAQPYRVQRSAKSAGAEGDGQTHLVVPFDGLLVCRDPARLRQALGAGIGPAKGYGCGLLSLARAA